MNLKGKLNPQAKPILKKMMDKTDHYVRHLYAYEASGGSAGFWRRTIKSAYRSMELAGCDTSGLDVEAT